MSKSSVRAQPLTQAEADIIGAWKAMRTREVEGQHTAISDLYTDYFLWCQERHHDATSYWNFMKRVLVLHPAATISAHGAWASHLVLA